MKQYILALFLTLSGGLYSQLNFSLCYNNRSILYNGAYFISGLNADLMYRNKRQNHSGIEFGFNQGQVFKKDYTTLGRHEGDAGYGRTKGAFEDIFTDTSLITRQFRGHLSYTYFSFTYKNFKSLAGSKNVEHFFGYNIGFNHLSQYVRLDDDSALIKKNFVAETMAHMVFGINYQYSKAFSKHTCFIFGMQMHVSTQLFPVTDFKGIDHTLLGLGLNVGCRYYFKPIN